MKGLALRSTKKASWLTSYVPFLPCHAFSPLFTHTVLKDAVAADVQALGPDLIEATEHAKRMSREEIEEVIDHILENVL